MYQIDNAEKCFEFLKSIYEDEVIPKFDQIELFEIDENLLDERGSEETVLVGNSKQLNYGKYYAVIRKPQYGEFTIPFDYERVILKENDELLFKKEASTLREQLSENSIKESDLIFIILDERCEIKGSSPSMLRALTIFSAEGIENSINYDSCLYSIELQLNHYEEQVLELSNLKMEFEINGEK